MPRLRLYTTILLALIAFAGASAPAARAAAEEGEDFDAVEHSIDGYYLDFSPFGKIELPRIFLVRTAEGGLGMNFYGSTAAALRSGAYVAHGGGGHGESEAASESDHSGEGHSAVAAGPPEDTERLIASGGHLYSEIQRAEGRVLVDFSISRHLVFAILGALIVILIFTRLAGKYKRGVGRETAPRGTFQNMMETLIVFIRDEVAKPNLGSHYNKYLPYLLTVFFFIFVCNLLGLVPFGATATSNITITAVLATFTFIITQVNASKDHWRHVFWPPGVPWPIKLILIPVEILGLFTKPFALAVRLFANLTAGHLIILSLIGLIFTLANLFGAAAGYGVSVVSVAFSLFIYMLELLVSFIQAYIFTMLSALFIGMAVEEHEHHEPDMAEGDTPALRGEDHSDVTPHVLDSGDGATNQRTRVTEPAAAG